MSKISIYEVVPVPKLADKLVGTSVGGDPEDITYNFTLSELLNLFIPNIPGNTLQGVLDFGNTATQNINLTGIITTTTLNVGSTANILNSNLTGQTKITGGLYDRLNSIGTAGQVLTSTGTQVEWYTIPTVIPDLQQVLTSGNTAVNNIILTGNLSANNAALLTSTISTSLTVLGTLRDGLSSVGTNNQVLSSNVTGVRWVNLPVYSATSPLLYNSGTGVFSIQQANASQNGYLSSADWITFDGKQTAISLTTTGNSGASTLVGATINVPNYTLSGLGGVPQTRTLTINGVTFNLSADRTWTLATGVSSVSATTPLFSTGGANPDISIQQSSSSLDGYLSSTDWLTFNSKQPAGNYITSLTGEATAAGPGAASVILSNAAVIGKLLTGLSITGSAISSSDSILTAFGKVQNQINGLIGGVQFQGVWNAATNTPALVSSVGTQGYYYIVDVAGNTNLNGITDWQVGDWAIFNGSTWNKVDNTDLVTSVNGQIGAVSLTTDNIPEGATNLYYLDSRARAALSFAAGSGAYNSTTGVITIPTDNSQILNGAGYITLVSLSATSPLTYNNTTGAFAIQVANTTQDGYLSSTDWNTFNGKQPFLGGTGLVKSVAGVISYITDNSANWNTAYNDSIVSAAVTGTATKTLTLNQQDGGTITASWSDIDTGLTSVGVSMPSAFTVTNSPLTSNGTIAITGSGNILQYVDGTGALQSFPSLTGYVPYTGATANVNLGIYNLTAASLIKNGGTSGQFLKADGSVDSSAYIVLGSLSATAPLSYNNTTGVFTISQSGASTNGYLSSTDWNTFNNKQATITLTTTGSSGASTLIGNTLNIPNYANLVTSVFGRIGAVVATEGDYSLTQLSDVTITTPSSGQVLKYNGTAWVNDIDTDTGITSLNGLTALTQTFAVGTSGTDFAISSVTSTHTFNLPTASVSNRGALSSADWTTFNSKEPAITAGTTLQYYRGDKTFQTLNTTVVPEGTNLYYLDSRARTAISLTTTGSSGASTYNNTTGVFNIPDYGSALSGYVPTSRQLSINGTQYDLSADRSWSVGTVTTVSFTLGASGTDLNSSVTNSTTTPAITLNVPTASAANRGALSAADWSTFNTKVGGVTATTPLFSSGGSTPNLTIQQSSGSQAGYLSSTDWTTFNNKQAAGNYITSLTGEATATGPGAAAVTLDNASVTAKILTGVNITGGTVLATDTMLTAFGKLQNQVNGLIGGSIYQGTWNASTNTPTLTSSVGTQGYYYIVSVAGNTNLNGITDWFVGDWAIFNGGVWQQVDNTDAVVSVNGQTGAVSLTTDNISEGVTNLYFTNTRARASLSFVAGSGAYNSSTGAITIPTNTSQLTNGANFITLASLSGTAPISYNSGTGAISITQSGTASNGYLSSTDWNTFNNKQATITLTTTGTSGAATLVGATLNIPQYQASGTYVTSVTGTSPIVSSGGTTPAISIPVATTSVNGYLSSTDWTTFNNKQNALTNPVTGTGTNNTIAKFTSTGSTIGDSSISDNSGSVLIGTNSGSQARFVSIGLNGADYQHRYILLCKYPTFGNATVNCGYRGKITMERTNGIGIDVHDQFDFTVYYGNQIAFVQTSYQAYQTSLVQLPYAGVQYLALYIYSAPGYDIAYVDAIQTNYGGWLDANNFVAIESLSSLHSSVSYSSNTTVFKQAVNVLGQLVLNSTISNGTYAYTLPGATGTLALTSDISYPVTSVFGRTGAVVATSGDYNTDQVTEGTTNLYFTNTRSRSALSFVAGSGAYNNTTGVITIPTNNNQITNGSNYITLASLSAGVGISYNNTTGVITNSAPDQTVAITASTGISVTGTYPNFTITNTSPSSGGTVTSVAALTIGTSGTDLSSSVANSTTTPVITLNVPTASATNRGALSSADWTTFNNKQSALTNPVLASGTWTSGYLPKINGTYTIGNSVVYESSSSIGIGTTNTTYARLNILSTSTQLYNGIAVYSTNGTESFLGLGCDGTNAGIDVTYGATGAYLPFVIKTGGSTKLTLSTSGNLGLGVTPSAWSVVTPVMQISTGGGFIGGQGSANVIRVGVNTFFNGSNWTYINSSFASWFETANGGFSWVNAPSGSANASFTPSTIMSLFSTGNLAINTTTDSGYKLDVNGTGRFTNTLRIDGTSSLLYLNNTTATTGKVWRFSSASNGNFYITQESVVDALTLSVTTGAATFSSDVTVGASSQLYLTSGDLRYSSNAGFGIVSQNGTRLVTIQNGAFGVTGAATFSSSVTTGGNMYVGAPLTTLGNDGGSQAKFVTIGLDGQDYRHRYILLCKYPTFGNTTVNCGYRGKITMERVNGIGIQVHDQFDLTVSYGNAIAFVQTSYQYNQTSLVQLPYAGVQYLALYIYEAPGYSIAYIDAIQTNYGSWLDGNEFTALNYATAQHSSVSYSSNTTVFKQAVSVNGSVTATSFIPSGSTVPTNGMYLSAANTLNFATNSGNRLSINSGGAAIFTSSVTATSFFESSDSRIKNLIKDDYKALGIQNIKPKLYIKDGKEEVGYFAQEIQSILPTAVSKNDAGFLSLSYTQVHTAKIAIIEDEVTILKRRVVELESKLN